MPVTRSGGRIGRVSDAPTNLQNPLPQVRRVTTIRAAVEACQSAKVSGWPMVTYAQRLICLSMQYSLSNPWDMPAKALRKGRGYCWQQARVLQRVLRRLGIDCALVYATRTRVPRHREDGVIVPTHVSAHIWCQVTLDGETRDVDPVDPNGKYTPLSKTRRWNWMASLISYPRSALASRHRDTQ